MKRVLALLLTLALVLGLMPTVLAAEPAGSGRTVAAEKVDGMSHMTLSENKLDKTLVESGYDDDDMVTVIVQLDAPALLDYYDPGEAPADISAGEAVSQFLSSSKAKSLDGELVQAQNKVVSEMAGNTGILTTQSVSSSDFTVLARYTTIVNAMAVRMPYGMLKDVRGIEGVKRAYVEKVYSLPVTTKASFGSENVESYSYGMVGAQAAWELGYTGKGMVVAVLDTGLDLDYDTKNNTVKSVHQAFTDSSFKSAAAGDMRFADEAAVLAAITDAGDQFNATELNAGSSTGMYKNTKVAFAFDYNDGDVNVRPNPTADGADHGTHVAGTVLGYSETADGGVEFTGIAPDAQLLAMKIFPDDASGAPESAIIPALEDAMLLGADIINLSIGSDNGFAEDDSAAGEMYAKVAAAGVVMMTSAGNSGYAMTNYGEAVNYDLYYFAEDPDMAMVGSPSTYPSNLSVASINSSVRSADLLVWNDGEADHNAEYADLSGGMRANFGPDYAGGPYEIVPVDGFGEASDYADAFGQDKSGIALVQRGEINFRDKVLNGENYTREDGTKPVKGVIVYNSKDDKKLINMALDPENEGDQVVSIPNCFIHKKDGDAIVKAIADGMTVTLSQVKPEEEFIDYVDAGQMSDFTSWGSTPTLGLKPEITAPGGSIWSSTFGAGTGAGYDGEYVFMSGTSMAAPHMSGLGALVKQRVVKDELASTAAEAAQLVQRLLVSTAVPQTDTYGEFYSPRRQGAGLADVEAALKTTAYITTDGQTVGKLELGDDPDWTDSFDFSFTVHNFGNADITYSAVANVMLPDCYGGYVFDSDTQCETIDLGNITVPAGGEKTVTGTISTGFDADALEELKAEMPNGTYIEGFITLVAYGDGDVPNIGLPFMGFLGDWTSAPIFDHANWYDGCTDTDDTSEPDSYDPDSAWYTWGENSIYSIYGGRYILPLGLNMFESNENVAQTVFHRENMTISPNGDGLMDSIDEFYLYQLREAKMLVFKVEDAETGDVYYSDYVNGVSRSGYNLTYGQVLPMTAFFGQYFVYDGTDAEGQPLPSGTRLIYSVTAYGDGDYGYVEDSDTNPETRVDYLISDYEGVMAGTREVTFNGHKLDMTGDVLSFPVIVDTVAPKLYNSAVSVAEEEGRTYVTGSIVDDGALASVAIYPIVAVSVKGSSEVVQVAVDEVNPYVSEIIYDAGMDEYKFKIDITEYAHVNESEEGENEAFDFTWTGDVLFYGGDYGCNEGSFVAHVEDMTDRGLLLTDSLIYMAPEDIALLGVVDNTGANADITRTSNNPDVADIDDEGYITAFAPGQAVITVTNGRYTATCLVVVEPATVPADVTDFALTPETFTGLQPGGSFTVSIVDLSPVDGLIGDGDPQWAVAADNADHQSLLTIEPSADGMSATVTLSNADAEDVPAGSGTVTASINGVSKTMSFEWDGRKAADNGLMSALDGDAQVVYVDVGGSVDLSAMYAITGFEGESDPLTWTVTTGSGELDAETVADDGTHTASFTPDGAGTCVITVTSADGAYSMSFTVVCQAVQAESIDLASHEMSLSVGSSRKLDVIYDPEPSLEADKALVCTSLDESVATVSADGTVTGVSRGTAYVKIALASNPSVWTYCVVTVTRVIPNLPSVPGTEAGDSGRFIDVASGAWYYDAVMAVADAGIMGGVAADRFDPNGLLTRGQIAQILYNMAGNPAVDTAEVQSTFTDVASGAWYTNAVAWAYAHEYLVGYGDGTIRPGQNITREQLVSVLYRYSKDIGKDINAPEGVLAAFEDGSTTSDYAVTAMSWAVSKGLVSGVTATAIAPRNTATRAQAAVILASYL